MGPEVPDLEAAGAHRLVSLGRPGLAGGQDPQCLAQRVHVGRMRPGSRRAEDHLVGRVVRRADLTAVMRKCVRIWQSNQAKIADQPGVIQFIEIAGLDVPVGNIEVSLQARQGLCDRCHGFDDISERPTSEGLGNGCRDGHSQPGPVCLARLVGQVRIEQREQPRRALVLSQEADLADESFVRLMLDLRDSEDLKGGRGLSAGTSRHPDVSIAGVAQMLVERPRADRLPSRLTHPIRSSCPPGHHEYDRHRRIPPSIAGAARVLQALTPSDTEPSICAGKPVQATRQHGAHIRH